MPRSVRIWWRLDGFFVISDRLPVHRGHRGRGTLDSQPVVASTVMLPRGPFAVWFDAIELMLLRNFDHPYGRLRRLD